MRKSKTDPRILDHLEWLGFVRPTGLVVSAPALVRAGAILDLRDIDGQRRLREVVEELGVAAKRGLKQTPPDFRRFAETVLGWGFSPKFFAGTDETPIPAELELNLPDAGEALRLDWAVREPEPKEGGTNWQLLVQELSSGEDLDRAAAGRGRLELSPHSRMERLLRGTGVAAGLLFNGRVVRLISAPRGESSGWLDFQVADMVTTAGRPICSAMRMLLSQARLLTMPKGTRLPALLEDSRKFQNEVSERLAEQVLHALYELLRGFQAAHDASKGTLLAEVLADDPDLVYRALLTVLLRIVFLLYAEERDMLPGDETFLQYYSLGGLHERLREDVALYPDTMDQRYGAWPQLLVLFRMVYDGAEYGDVKLPSRHGDLFAPERFRFLEGRNEKRVGHERIEAPLVSDGTIYRALEKLLVLDGERLSYRALDVEQIGSVYETMMGFRIETASGRSIAIRAEKKHGAPTMIDLEALLGNAGEKREKWLQDNVGRKLSDSVKKAVKDADSLVDLHAALDKVTDKQATPDIVPEGSLILQPSEERRRSGSHYTPRNLTEPIVRTTLEPILARMKGDGEKPPKPEQILGLKICDPAMGSGAFLVEACRHLADALIESWRAQGFAPVLSVDEDEIVYARRLVAQRCLYGVDKNPMAVDLAKVSLWLATLAKDHAFTFLDHSLKCGDSLVGLTNRQILAMTWEHPEEQPLQPLLLDETLPDRIRQAGKARTEIALSSEHEYDELAEELENASLYVNDLRLVGDGVVAAFFSVKKPKERITKLAEVHELAKALFKKPDLTREGELRERLKSWSDWLATPPRGLSPFHWELEFAEIYARAIPGFDAFVGNPPFAGRTTISTGNPDGYIDWLLHTHKESHGNADLVAHFFRRVYNLLRDSGTLGLIATNTVGQGDTRSSGLRIICSEGGRIYNVCRRIRWPGLAAVVVSIIHIAKHLRVTPARIDDRIVENITAFLFHLGGSEDPCRLSSNLSKSFQGSVVVGVGFTFDDDDTSGLANRLALRNELIESDPTNGEVIFSYLGGEELNASPTMEPSRFIINFGRLTQDDARRRYPQLLTLVESTVLAERTAALRKSWSIDKQRRVDRWWQFARPAEDLYEAIHNLDSVYALSQTSKYLIVARVSSNIVFSNKLVVFPYQMYAPFAVLQAQTHESWANLMGSSMKDDPVYTPSDCFDTFPFPHNWESEPTFEVVGKAYYEFRSDLMIRKDEGLTKTYNRFHDPEEISRDILRLRELHAEMDRAVLDAYGWTDIPTECNFILDYEDDEEEDTSGKRKKKKPWRYRWPDEVRYEVLARLLELNALRAKEEELAGANAGKKTKVKTQRNSDPLAAQTEMSFE